MHIFTDLDGTLIQDGAIKESDILKIRKFTQQGNKISIATGRSYSSIKHLKGAIDFEYCICCNGAYIVDKNEKVIYANTFEEKTFKKLLKLQSDKYTSGISNGDTFIIRDGKDKPFANPVFLNYSPKKKSQKLANEMVEQIKALKLDKEIEISVNGTHVDIGPANASKGIAIAYLANKFKIDTNDIFVVGDQKNDISMFDLFENSYCIRVGNKEAKKAANTIVRNVGDLISEETFTILK